MACCACRVTSTGSRTARCGPTRRRRWSSTATRSRSSTATAASARSRASSRRSSGSRRRARRASRWSASAIAGISGASAIGPTSRPRRVRCRCTFSIRRARSASRPTAAPTAACRPIRSRSACRVDGADPVVLDVTTSMVAEGKLMVALNKGERVPEGWIIDKNGAPTTNPKDFYDGGALLTVGAHKGSGLSIVTDLLAGAVSTGRSSDADDPILRNNMLSIYIAPAVYDADGVVAREARRFVDFVKASAPAKAGEPVLAPGDVERRNRAARLASGVSLDEKTWADLLAAAASVGVDANRDQDHRRHLRPTPSNPKGEREQCNASSARSPRRRSSRSRRLPTARRGHPNPSNGSSPSRRAAPPTSSRAPSARSSRSPSASPSSSRTSPARGAVSAPNSPPRQRPTATRSWAARSARTRSTRRSTRTCRTIRSRISWRSR